MTYRYAICNETYQGWDWESACRHAAATGYTGIEIAPFTLAPDVRQVTLQARRDILAMARRHGLAVTGLHWLLVSPKGLSMTSPDGALRDETSDYLVALADFCADTGGCVLTLGSPAQRRIADGETADIARNRMAATIAPALDRAADRGVIFCIEPLPAPEADLLITIGEAAAFLEQVGHPAAYTILDVKSASSETTDVAGLYRRHAGIVRHVHANDANRHGPGAGATDFRPILAALNAERYSGYVSVEVFDYSPGPEAIAANALAYMRSCEPA